jgi:hypothetical protein
VIVDNDQKKPQQQARPPLDFQEVKVFSDPESKLAVRIMAAKMDNGAHKYKRETGEIVDVNGQERFFRGHKTFYDIVDGTRVKIREINFQVFEALYMAAGDYIRNDIQAERDEYDARRKNQGPPPRPGLKTLSKQDRARRTG